MLTKKAKLSELIFQTKSIRYYTVHIFIFNIFCKEWRREIAKNIIKNFDYLVGFAHFVQESMLIFELEFFSLFSTKFL